MFKYETIFSTIQLLSHKQNIVSLSLLYRYYYDWCSDELHSLVPPVLTMTARSHHAIFTVVNHPYSVRAPLITSKFHLNSFLLRTLTFVEQTSERLLPWKLQSWSLYDQGRHIYFLLIILSYFPFLSFKITLSNWVTLGPCIGLTINK